MKFRIAWVAAACLIPSLGGSLTHDNGSSLAAREVDPMERL